MQTALQHLESVFQVTSTSQFTEMMEGMLLCCCSLEFSTVIVQVMTMDITISLKMPTNCTVMCLCLCLQITLIWQFVTMLCCLRLYFLFTRPLPVVHYGVIPVITDY